MSTEKAASASQASTAAAPAAASTSAEETKATPVFGSASTFGSGTGFAGVSNHTEARSEPAVNGTEEEAPEEEECQAEFQPLVQLQEVETTTGEEGEAARVDFKCKLYRFDSDAGEWKERGVGRVRLLEHQDNKRVRLLMRQEKTLKIRANHIIMPGTKLQEHSGNDKSWVWSAVDFAEGEQKPELFCIRFASVERAAEFKKEYEKAVLHNESLLGISADGSEAPAENTKADSAADELAEGVKKVNVSGDAAAPAKAKAETA